MYRMVLSHWGIMEAEYLIYEDDLKIREKIAVKISCNLFFFDKLPKNRPWYEYKKPGKSVAK